MTSKNRTIVPYHRCAWIPRLTVSVPDYGSWFLSCLVSRNVFHVVSALQSIVFTFFFFWLIGSLVDSTLAAFVVCGPLQFLVSQKKRLFLISAKLRKENKKNATAGGEQVDYLPAWPSQLTDRV